MNALEQLASKFTLAELADRAGITLAELLSRTISAGSIRKLALRSSVTKASTKAVAKAVEKSSKTHSRTTPDPLLDTAVLAALRATKGRVQVSALTTDPKIVALMSKSGGKIAETIARLIAAGHSIKIEGQTRGRTYELVRG